MYLNLSATNNMEVIKIQVVSICLDFQRGFLRPYFEFAGKNHVNVSWMRNPLVD